MNITETFNGKEIMAMLKHISWRIQPIEQIRSIRRIAMTNTERIINFCIEYFNKHDAADEPITANDIYIMSYTDIGMGWSAAVYMPDGYIYELNTVDVYGTVAFNKYKKCGGSLYKWEED